MAAASSASVPSVPSRRDVLRAAPLAGVGVGVGVASLVLPTAAAHASVAGAGAGGTPLDVRSYLSTAGRAAHDAAASGGFFVVSAEDLAAVRTGLAAAWDVTTVGMSDALMAERGAETWGATSAATLSTAAWPAGAVLLGGVFGTNSGQTPTVTILRGQTATGDHVALAPGVTGVLGTTQLHVLRRDPVATATTASLACVGARGRTTTSLSFHYASAVDVDGTPTYRTWLPITAAAPRQQYLVAVAR